MRQGLYVLFALVLSPVLAHAVQVGGSLNIDQRLFTSDLNNLTYVNREDILMLRVQHERANAYRVKGSLRARYFDRTQYTTIDQLADRGKVQPVEFEVWEARLDLYGLISEDLDVTLGKQIISWGKGDGINPTNYLAPFDLSDPIDFTTRLPVWAARFHYYFPFWDSAEPTLQFVWLPSHTPMIAPPYGMDAFGAGALPRGASLRIDEPPFALDSSIAAVKFGATVAGVDFSASYQYTWGMVPTLAGIPTDMASGGTSPIALGFPRLQVLGSDFSTELFGVGMWGEVAVIIPDAPSAPAGNYWSLQQIPLAIAAQIPGGIKKPATYVQYVAGIDYTFPRSIYLNVQFVRGLFFETTPDMNDYLMTNLRFFPFRSLKIEGMYGMAVDNLKTYTKDTMGFFGSLGVTWRGIPDVDIGLQQFMFAGGRNSIFGAFANYDQLKLFANVKF